MYNDEIFYDYTDIPLTLTAIDGLLNIASNNQEMIELDKERITAAILYHGATDNLTLEDVDSGIVAANEYVYGSMTLEDSDARSFFRRMWDGLKEAMRKAINAFMEFFARMFRGVKALKKQLDNLRAAIEKQDNWNAALDVNAGKYIDRIRYENKIDVPSVLAGVTHMNTGGRLVYGNYLSAVIAYYDALGIRLNDASRGDKSYEELFGAADGSGIPAKVKEINNVIDKLKEGNAAIISGDLRLVASGRGTGEDVVVNALELKKEKQQSLSSTTIKSGGKSEISRLLSETDKVISNIEGSERDIQALKSKRDDMIRKGDTFTKITNNEEFVQKWGRKKISAVYKIINANISRGIDSYTKHMWNVARAILLYVDDIYKAQVKETSTAGSEDTTDENVVTA